MNEISRKHGLSPATVNKCVTGKVIGLGSQLGGAQRYKDCYIVVISVEGGTEEEERNATASLEEKPKGPGR